MIEDEIVRRLHVLRDELGPGQRVPPERELAAAWGTSRATLRDRFRRFEAIGAMERRGAAGTFTRQPTSEDVAAILELGIAGALSPSVFLAVRIALERQSAKLAAEQGRPIPIAHIEASVLSMDATTDAGALYDADREFHRALLRAPEDQGLTFFAEAIDDLVVESVKARGEQRDRSLNVVKMREIHRGIFEAIRRRDPHAAMAAVDRHFDEMEHLV